MVRAVITEERDQALRVASDAALLRELIRRHGVRQRDVHQVPGMARCETTVLIGADRTAELHLCLDDLEALGIVLVEEGL